MLSFASLATSSDAELEALLFPEKRTQPFNRRMPDFEQASNELAQNGVTLKLLWAEYCEDCRQANQQPFMYSQFFCSQFEPTGWSGKFPEATIADAILDRIVHDSYSIEIKAADQEHQASMREIYGLDGQIAK